MRKANDNENNQQMPGFYRFHTGDIEVTCVNDGTLSGDINAIVGLAVIVMLGLCAAAAPAVAPKPLYCDPVYDGAAAPTLIWDRAGHRWVMFYTNRRASAKNLPGVSWVHGTRIGMAESADGGATWKYTGTAQIHYGKPDYTHWAPEVIENDGIYHMYLSIVPGIFNDWKAPREIVHLTSQNLKDWQYESTLDLRSDRVIDPCVIRLPDGRWRLWFKNERAQDGSISSGKAATGSFSMRGTAWAFTGQTTACIGDARTAIL